MIKIPEQLNFKLIKEFQFLFESERRLQILYEICNGANTARLLKERINIPRRSLNRCLQQLAKKSLIDMHGNGYNITDFGKLFLEEVLKFKEQAISIYALKEGKSCFTPSSFRV